MDSYADINYYKNTFKGEKIITDDNDIINKLLLASQKIDEITYNRIIGRGLNKFTIFQQSRIKEAVCYQANYIHEYGIDGPNIASYSVLDINISVGDNNSMASKLHVSDSAYNLIKQTGLTNGIL